MRAEQAGLLLSKIADNLPSGVTAVQIGGNAMLFHKLRAATLDLDLVFSKVKETPILAAVKAAGFIPTERIEEPPFIRARNVSGDVIDLFFGQVGEMVLTSEIIRRAKKVEGLENVLVASKEDVFVFKAITDRHQDLEDLRTLIQSGLDFSVIETGLSEQPLRNQIAKKMKMTLERLKETLNIELPQLERILVKY